MKTKIILIFCITLLFLCGCSPNKNNANDSIQMTTTNNAIPETIKDDKNSKEAVELSSSSNFEITEKDFKIGKIELYMKFSDVRNAIGKDPIESSEETDEIGKSMTLKYDDGTVIQLLDDEVYSISVTSSDYITPRGLAIGDSAEKVIDLYGEPLNKESVTWDFEGFGEYDLFHVDIKDNRVVGITVNLVM